MVLINSGICKFMRLVILVDHLRKSYKNKFLKIFPSGEGGVKMWLFSLDLGTIEAGVDGYIDT